MRIWGYSEIEFAAGWVLIFFATLSLLATSATLWLIIDMQRRNGYLLIIFTLSVCQLLFDLQFIFVPFYQDRTCNRVTAFLNILGGFSVCLWTNAISFLLYRIVQHLKSVKIEDYYLSFLITITSISLMYAILENVMRYDYDSTTVDVVYNVFRACSVAFNFSVHFRVSMKLRQMGFIKSTAAAADGGGGCASHYDPVRVLSSRIKYYPIVQVVTLSGAFWYVFMWGFDTESYGNNPMSAAQQASLIFYAVSLPSAGLGYFIVFLLFQPQAYSHLMRKLRNLSQSPCCCCCCCFAPVIDSRGDGLSVSTPDSRSGGLRMTTSSNTNAMLSAFPLSSGDKLESLLTVDVDGNCEDMDEDQLVQAMESRLGGLSSSIYTNDSGVIGSGGGSSSSESGDVYNTAFAVGNNNVI